MPQQFDIAVVGGGMVGAAVATGLAQQGKSVALIEAVEPQAYSAEQPFDARVSAISYTSVELLNSLGAWQRLQQMRTAPFRRLETWEKADSRIRFSAQDIGVEELGFIVENRLIQLALWQGFAEQKSLSLFCPAKIERIEFLNDKNRLQLNNGEQIEASLVVAADGAHSVVRKLAGIGLNSWDYDQHCMLINVATEAAQQDITWQWFTPTGPRSLLPLPGSQASLVWYDSASKIRQLNELSNEQLTQAVVQAFPDELGGIQVLSKASFALTRRHAKQYFAERCVLVGDAAHTINPLAGQGVNLGFKDVQALLQVLSKANWNSEQALAVYQRKRRLDNQLMQSAMDAFYFGFSNQLAPLKWARNAVLKTAERSTALKRQVLKYALGIR